MAEKKGEKQDKKDAKIKKEMKMAAKGVEKDERLKKPTSAYWMWLNEVGRSKVQADLQKKGLPTKLPDIAKAAGEAWKNLPAGQKAPFEKKAKEQKDAHDAYVKSEDGQAALKAHKDAVAEAKSSIKGAPPLVEKKSGKRKAEDSAEDEDEQEEGDDGAKEPSPKKGRGRPAKNASEESPTTAKPKAKAKGKAKPGSPEQPTVDPAILDEADKLGLKGPVLNLINREEIASKNFKPQEILSALKQSKGLVNKAKNILLAGA